MASLNVAFKCPVCGGAVVNMPDDYDEHSRVQCDGCGAELGQWGHLKDASGKLLSDKAEASLSHALRHVEGWQK